MAARLSISIAPSQKRRRICAAVSASMACFLRCPVSLPPTTVSRLPRWCNARQPEERGARIGRAIAWRTFAACRHGVCRAIGCVGRPTMKADGCHSAPAWPRLQTGLRRCWRQWLSGPALSAVRSFANGDSNASFAEVKREIGAGLTRAPQYRKATDAKYRAGPRQHPAVLPARFQKADRHRPARWSHALAAISSFELAGTPASVAERQQPFTRPTSLRNSFQNVFLEVVSDNSSLTTIEEFQEPCERCSTKPCSTLTGPPNGLCAAITPGRTP